MEAAPADAAAPASCWQLRRVSDLPDYGRTPALLPLSLSGPTTIGRASSSHPPDHVLESPACPMMLSRRHATIRPGPGGGAPQLTDSSLNGTYVNWVRVGAEPTTLCHGDIVCFGHKNGSAILAGEVVGTFRSELKFQVEAPAEAQQKRPQATQPQMSPEAAEEAADNAPSCPAVKRPRADGRGRRAEGEDAVAASAPLAPLPINALPAAAAPTTRKRPRKATPHRLQSMSAATATAAVAARTPETQSDEDPC